MTVRLDFETYSECDLTEAGAYAYAEHPSTVPLCLVYTIDGVKGWWRPEDHGWHCPPDLALAIWRGHELHGWNVNFERQIWLRVMAARYGWPVPPRDEQWRCSMALAAQAAMPLALDECNGALGLPEGLCKDKDGRALLKLLAEPHKATKKKPGGRQRDEAAEWRLLAYCGQDVVAEEANASRLPPMQDCERAVFALDRRINDRGVQLDLPLIRAMIRIRDDARARAERGMSDLTGGVVTAATQTQRITEWANAQGANLFRGIGKDALELYRQQDYIKNPRVQKVIELYQQSGKSSVAKLDVMLGCVGEDGRARGLLQYHGASTGRQAGRLIQPQNFTKPTLTYDGRPVLQGGKLVKIDPAILMTGRLDVVEAVYGPGTALTVLADSLRACITASPGRKLPRADLNAVEARVVLWLAGHEDAMEIFRSGACIYCEQASALTGRKIVRVKGQDDPPERQNGKQIILGCGFQMGDVKFLDSAHKAGWMIDEDMAKLAVRSYRDRWWRVPKLWSGLNDAAVSAVRAPGRYCEYQGCGYRVEGDYLTCRLPTGRKLFYYRPALQIDPEKEWAGEGVVYWANRQLGSGARVWTQVSGYGGLWTENNVQAIARDCMMHGALLAEDEGYELVMMVHDETIADDVKDHKGLEQCLGVTPASLPGLVLKAEGKTDFRYGK